MTPISRGAQADEPTTKRAHDIFERGRQLYYAAKYEEAIAMFESGYEVAPRPLFLVNIAQAYRQLHDPVRSRDYFARFLAMAPKNDPQRSSVEKAIAELDQEIIAQRPAERPRQRLGPDQEVARMHFAKATKYYDEGDYARALSEFDAARALDAHPELDYDVARCHDRLGEWSAAAAGYQSFLDESPSDPQADEARARLAILRARVGSTAPNAQAAPSSVAIASRRFRTPAIVMAATTGALAISGTGAYLSVYSQYTTDRTRCDKTCSPQSVTDLRSKVTTAQVAGGVLWGLAGAAAVVDLTLWIVDRRTFHETRRETGAVVTF